MTTYTQETTEPLAPTILPGSRVCRIKGRQVVGIVEAVGTPRDGKPVARVRWIRAFRDFKGYRDHHSTIRVDALRVVGEVPDEHMFGEVVRLNPELEVRR